MHEFVQSNECEAMTIDKKLMESVLGEKWRAARIAIIADDARVGEFSTLFSARHGTKVLNEERARQAALGHQALRLLAEMAGANPMLLDLNPELGAIIRELRGES